jgi:hypothetical protein
MSLSLPVVAPALLVGAAESQAPHAVPPVDRPVGAKVARDVVGRASHDYGGWVGGRESGGGGRDGRRRPVDGSEAEEMKKIFRVRELAKWRNRAVACFHAAWGSSLHRIQHATSRRAPERGVGAGI